MKRGDDWFIREDWTPYFDWLEPRLFQPGRWAVIPDAPGAPSQLNDSLLPLWPFGERGAPLWHMDGPIERLLRLCDRYPRVCLGWVGKGKSLDNPAYHARMDEVAPALGNRWPVLHMMRGLAVLPMYPFASADGTTLAQNGWRYDTAFDFGGDRWRGRKAYADKIEGADWRERDLVRSPQCAGRSDARSQLRSDSMVERTALRNRNAKSVEQLAFEI
jgi:hypothetical protein